MRSKRFRRVDHNLCRDAVIKCFEHKWRRSDTLAFIEEYAGIDRKLIIMESLCDEWEFRKEVIESLAYMVEDAVRGIVDYGIDPEAIEPVKIRNRPDGMTGKRRDIALLCIMHQLLGHVAKLIIEPLIDARLYPTQHASIPGRGQTKLKSQVHGYLLRESLGVNYIQKTDVVHAYATLMYGVIEKILIREIPKCRDGIVLIRYLGTIAPGGHLIIGGYLDAWLFNFAMSYAIAHLYSLQTSRRGKTKRVVVRVASYMDDFAIMTTSVKNMKIAVKELKRYCNDELGVDIKTTTGTMKILTVAEEKRRKELPKPSQRGVPMLDMAGYRVSRTHVTIRRRVFLRIRRQLLRASAELDRLGTLSRSRAQKIIAYYGYIKQTDSRKLCEKYRVDELVRAAKRVSSFYSKIDHKKRKEQLNDLRKYYIEHPAPKGTCRTAA